MRSSTAISTLASNNAANQIPFVVEESSEEEEEENDNESNEREDKGQETPKKRPRGRPKAVPTPLSPNNPFAAITREYKEQQKIAAKLKRKRKSSLSPDDRPRLLTEAENNRLFDSLFAGDTSPPPPPVVVKQKSRSSNSSKKKLLKDSTDTSHKTLAHAKSVAIEANKKVTSKSETASTKTESSAVPRSVGSGPPSNVPPSSLKWLQSPSSASLRSPARVVAPWRQICDPGPRLASGAQAKQETGDVYEFSGPGEPGAGHTWGGAHAEMEKQRLLMISKHGAYSGHLAGIRRKLEQRREPEPGPGERGASPEPEQANGSPQHKVSGSPMIEPSQRVGTGTPRLSGKSRLGSQRLGGAIKGALGGAASHQLSLTSLASDYNIVAAVDKYHNNSNTPEDPGSAPDTLHNHSTSEPGSDQRQPDNGRRKSFLLSRIFSKPKDQDDDSGTEDNSAPTEKEELSVSETKKVRQNKQTTAPQKSKDTALRRPLRNSSSRNVSLREAASSDSESGGTELDTEEDRLGPERQTNTSIVCTSCHK